MFSILDRPFRVNGCHKAMGFLCNQLVVVKEIGGNAIEFVNIAGEIDAFTIFGAEDIADIVYVADKDDFVEAIAVLILTSKPMCRKVIGCLC
jgi:hypothetical protein